MNNWYWIMLNEILFSKELSDKQKLLFCMISSLCAKTGYCWSTNKYIWEKLWVSENTISTNISKLNELWFIYVEIEWWYKRKIQLIGVLEKSRGGIGKIKGGVLEKSKDNIISNNIIKENISSKEDIELRSVKYWNLEINQILNIIKSNNGWIMDWTLQEQRRYANLLNKKLKELDSVKKWKYKYIDILEIIIKIIRQNKYHSHKLSSPKKIYYWLWELMLICKQQIELDKWKEMPFIPVIWW